MLKAFGPRAIAITRKWSNAAGRWITNGALRFCRDAEDPNEADEEDNDCGMDTRNIDC